MVARKKLTDDEVRIIRREYTRPGSGYLSNAQELAERFGVGIGLIREIGTRRQRANVPDAEDSLKGPGDG